MDIRDLRRELNEMRRNLKAVETGLLDRDHICECCGAFTGRSKRKYPSHRWCSGCATINDRLSVKRYGMRAWNPDITLSAVRAKWEDCAACALCGKELPWQSSGFHLDHIIPLS